MPATLYCSLGGITNLAIARDFSCLFSRVAQFGVRDIAEELVTETGLPLEHAEQWLLHVGLETPLDEVGGDPGRAAATARSVLERNASRLADELRLSLDYYGAQEGAAPVDGVVLCGWGSADSRPCHDAGHDPRPRRLDPPPRSAVRLQRSRGSAPDPSLRPGPGALAMRPINLIPQEERRSHGGGSRSGPLAYIVVGSLAILLIGVVMVVLASNQISDREDEVATLETRRSLAAARADRLAPYANFAQVAQQRTQTTVELADSRFDWPRVIRQLSLILPPQVYLESLTGSGGGGSGEEATSGVTGPSLVLSGCAPGQETVAALVASLKEIDGVTRVGLNDSTVSTSESQSGDDASYCSRGTKARFEIVVAFDAAPRLPTPAQPRPSKLRRKQPKKKPRRNRAKQPRTPPRARKRRADPMNQSTKTALAVVAVIALAGAFWLLLLGPKREKAEKLSEQVTSLRAEVTAEQQRADAALVAKHEFPHLYAELVLLGKAVPPEAATPSLLVQLNGVSGRADTTFKSISAGGGSEEAATATSTATEGSPELPPLGSSVGPAGFSAMPYGLQFAGGFFNVADFIEGLDSLVTTKDGVVNAKGRLVTIDGFSLEPTDEEAASLDDLAASFEVTTYVTPPGQGLTAGATPAGPSTTSAEEP